MKKEDFFRFRQYQKIVKNYTLPRIIFVVAVVVSTFSYLALKIVEKDPVSLSFHLASAFLYLCLAVSIFTTLITLFVWIPTSGNKYEYTEAKIRLKLINEMAEE